MLPNNQLNVNTNQETFAFFNDKHFEPLTCYCKGGSDIGRTIDGVINFDWQLKYEENSFLLTGGNNKSYVLGQASTNETVISVGFCFNQNLQLNWCYETKEAGNVNKLRFYWFDVKHNKMEYTLIDGTSPFLVLDDYRIKSSSISDVILFYVIDNTLYYRYQRERFLIEHPSVKLNKGERIIKVGLTTGLRVQLYTQKLISKTVYDYTKDADGNIITDEFDNPIWDIKTIYNN